MSDFWHRMGRISGLTLIAVALSAGCGGRSENSEADGASGGQAAAGGASSAGFSGASHGGEPGYPGGSGGTLGASNGGAFPGGEGARGGGENGCVYAGNLFAVGATFASSDGCNTCTCIAPNSVGCTQKACVCESAEITYYTALEEAKACDPTLNVAQCSQEITEGLACGCTAFINPANAAALERMKQSAAEYFQNGCMAGVVCMPCLKPSGGRCSPEGRCENTFVTGRGCEVGGVRYVNGATGIPDPVSCNKCSCSDGNLVCTEINCPIPCRAGTAYGTSCAQCGPTDACEVTAYGCYPICVDRCDNIGEICVGGLCKPGFCG